MDTPNVVTNVFLRLYAANLERNRRNDPTSACQDAVRQLAALGGCLVACAFAICALVVSHPFFQHFYTMDMIGLSILVIGSLAVSLWIWVSYRGYAAYPERAEPFRTQRSVRVINILYVAAPLTALWALGLFAYYVHH